MTVNESPQVSDSRPAKPSLATIDALTFMVMPRGYAWPASALNGSDMQRLNEIKIATRKPVTELLQDAIDLLYEATASKRAAVAEQVVTTRRKARNVTNPAIVKKQTELLVQRTLFDEGPNDFTSCAES